MADILLNFYKKVLRSLAQDYHKSRVDKLRKPANRNKMGDFVSIHHILQLIRAVKLIRERG